MYGNPPISNLLAGLNYLPFGAPRWMHVTPRFNNFLNDLSLTKLQIEDGTNKIKRIVKCLNKHYWNLDSDSPNYLPVGSWGKNTQIRPPRDIDILFLLPTSVYMRFESRSGNKQSQLLQEIKEVINRTFSTTELKGDGQVVVAPFASFKVEVVPIFHLSNQIIISDANNGGKYNVSNPFAEIELLQNINSRSNGNANHLICMLKCWQMECNISLESFLLELLAIEFLMQWSHCGQSSFWYDWMIRDFFEFLKIKANSRIVQPSTQELIFLGDDWLSKAQKAHEASLSACYYESLNEDALAHGYWKIIFGNTIRRTANG